MTRPRDLHKRVIMRSDAPDGPKLTLYGVWQSPGKPRLLMIGLPPDKGRKTGHLLMVTRPVRSKYQRVECMNDAKRCRAGTCPHVARVSEVLWNCKPSPHTESAKPIAKGRLGAI